MMSPASEHGVTSLLGDLVRVSSTLFRQEAALARAEIGEKLATAGSSLSGLAIGLVLLQLGLGCLLAAAAVALAQEIGWWQALASIGAAVLLLSAAMVLVALSHLRMRHLAPSRTLASLRRVGGLAGREEP